MVIVLTSIEYNTVRSGDVQIESYTLEFVCINGGGFLSSLLKV